MALPLNPILPEISIKQHDQNIRNGWWNNRHEQLESAVSPTYRDELHKIYKIATDRKRQVAGCAVGRDGGKEAGSC